MYEKTDTNNKNNLIFKNVLYYIIIQTTNFKFIILIQILHKIHVRIFTFTIFKKILK